MLRVILVARRLGNTFQYSCLLNKKPNRSYLHPTHKATCLNTVMNSDQPIDEN